MTMSASIYPNKVQDYETETASKRLEKFFDGLDDFDNLKNMSLKVLLQL